MVKLYRDNQLAFTNSNSSILVNELNVISSKWFYDFKLILQFYNWTSVIFLFCKQESGTKLKYALLTLALILILWKQLNRLGL